MSDSWGAGSHSVNVVPAPSRLSTVTSPAISRASRRLIVSPSPVPPCSREYDDRGLGPSGDIERLAWVNGSKIVPSWSSGMPMPVSTTRM